MYFTNASYKPVMLAINMHVYNSSYKPILQMLATSLYANASFKPASI